MPTPLLLVYIDMWNYRVQVLDCINTSTKTPSTSDTTWRSGAKWLRTDDEWTKKGCRNAKSIKFLETWYCDQPFIPVYRISLVFSFVIDGWSTIYSSLLYNLFFFHLYFPLSSMAVYMFVHIYFGDECVHDCLWKYLNMYKSICACDVYAIYSS